MMASASRLQILAIYRAILRNARFYPSRKRGAIIEEIKSIFHENKDLTDPGKVSNELQKARIGLQELQQFRPDSLENAGWSIQLRGSTLPEGVTVDDIK
jgi:LYR motif-containing protein 4